MPTLIIDKQWLNTQVLLESDLDKIKDDIETFINDTKLDEDNLQLDTITSGMTATQADNIAGNMSLTGAKSIFDVSDGSHVMPAVAANKIIEQTDGSLTAAGANNILDNTDTNHVMPTAAADKVATQMTLTGANTVLETADNTHNMTAATANRIAVQMNTTGYNTVASGFTVASGNKTWSGTQAFNGDVTVGGTEHLRAISFSINSGPFSNVTSNFAQLSTDNTAAQIQYDENDIGLNIVAGVSTASTDERFIQFADSGAVRGSIVGSGAGGVIYNITSDRRLKENILSYNNIDALEIVNGLKVREFNFKGIDVKRRTVGLIAQEAKKVFPQIVSGSPRGDVKERPMMINYPGLIPILIAAIQELSDKIDNNDD